MNELVFFQWCTGLLLVATLLWVAAFGVLLFRDRPRYHRSER